MYKMDIIKVCPNRNYTQSISFSPPFTNNNNDHTNFINKTKLDIYIINATYMLFWMLVVRSSKLCQIDPTSTYIFKIRPKYS